MSKTSRVAPFLPYYYFNQSFRCVEDLDVELAGIAADICNYAEAAKEKSWFEFWQAQGDEIVLRLWKVKYKDYVDDDVEDQSSNDVLTEQESVTKEKTASSDSSIHDDHSIVDTNTLSWQTLWEEHNTEIYTDQYKKFEDIFDNYFWLLKEALSNQIDTEKSEAEYYTKLKSEFEQLKLAGLPTAFGSKSQLNNKKRKVKNQEDFYELPKSQAQEEFYELTEVDLNEEDSDDDEFFSATDTSDNEFEMPPIKQNATLNKPISKPKKNRTFRCAPAFMQEEKQMRKYWRQRFSLFSRFDEGIQLDRESWFSVTPEKVAQHVAERIRRDVVGTGNGLTVLDGFCGCGGNTIQFALTCDKVIAIDIDPKKIEMAKHNAEIYGVADKIEFIVGDFLHLSQMGTLKADAVFLSPPWGGPEYKSMKTYNIEMCLEPVSATELMRVARCISNNIAFFLPRNADMKQIIRLAGVGQICEVEHNFLDSRIVGLTAFYGNCIAQQDEKGPTISGLLRLILQFKGAT